MEVMSIVILAAAALVAISVFTSIIAFRAGVPILLVFLGVGLGAGVDGLGIYHDNEELTFFIGSVALAIILFDSGFQTRLQSFKVAAGPAIVLATVGVGLTAALVAPVAALALGLSLPEALLLGAVIGSTDAAAVFFLLRVGGITIRERVRSTLEIESGSNDPMAIFLTMALLTLVRVEFVDWGAFAMDFVQQFGLGIVLGVAGGFAIALVVNRVTLDPSLYAIVVLALALVVFAVTNLVGGSGFLAAYIAGITAGNARLRIRVGILRFQNGLTWLSQMVMFVTLGLYATPSQFPAILGPSLIIAAALILVARPIAVWLCLRPFGFTGNETAFVGWVGLRGAVSILLALLPMIDLLPAGPVIFNAVFLIVLTSLIVQGSTIGAAARWLGVRVPVKRGPVERVELELPKLPGYELVSYHIPAEAPVTRGHRLPRWARPALVHREGTVLTALSAGPLRTGDHVYFIATPRKMLLLDKLFSAPAPPAEDDREFFGDFVLKPEATLGMVADMYGASIPDDQRDLTLAEMFARRYRSNFAVGDRISLGELEFIIRDVEEDVITSVGLAVEPTQVSRSRMQQVTGRLRAILARLRARKAERSRDEP